MTIDTENIRRRVVSIRAAAERQVDAIASGRPRHKADFRLWTLPEARAIMDELTNGDPTPPAVAAEVLIGACDGFEALLDIVEANPALADRLHMLLIEVAALIHSNVLALSAPTDRSDDWHARLSRRARSMRRAEREGNDVKALG